MKAFLRLTVALIFLAGWLVLPNPGGAMCISPVVTPECEALIGVRVVSLLIEVQEGAAVHDLSKSALRDRALDTIRKLIPQIRIEDGSARAPQIHIVVARLNLGDGESSIHLQVEVRDVGIRDGRLTWNPVWLTSYVIPSSAQNPASDLEDNLNESLMRLAADWRRANP